MSEPSELFFTQHSELLFCVAPPPKIKVVEVEAEQTEAPSNSETASLSAWSKDCALKEGFLCNRAFANGAFRAGTFVEEEEHEEAGRDFFIAEAGFFMALRFR